MPRRPFHRTNLSRFPIANVNNRQVTYSIRKRRLFKKAAEICILTGAKVALIVQSSRKRVYTFGFPDVDTVLDGYQNGYQIPVQPWDELAERQQQKIHNDEYNKLCLELENEKKKLAAVENGENLSSEIPWFEKPLDGMSLEELLEILTPLKDLLKNVENSLKHGNSQNLGTENNNVIDDHLSWRLRTMLSIQSTNTTANDTLVNNTSGVEELVALMKRV